MGKTHEITGAIIHDAELHDHEVVSEKLGTTDDQRDMLRMGKTQALRVSGVLQTVSQLHN